MSKNRSCVVFKGSKLEMAYLYVDQQQDLNELPEGLLASFGDPEKVLDVELNSGSKLALVKASDVLQSIEEKGFFLQMPPASDHGLRKFLES